MFKRLIKGFILFNLGLISLPGAAQQKYMGPEIGLGVHSKTNSQPKIGLPGMSGFVGFRRESYSPKNGQFSLMSGVQIWIPRSGTDQVSLLKDSLSLPDYQVESRLMMGQIEGHFALKYTFNGSSSKKTEKYLAMGLGVNLNPFQETIPASLPPVGYAIPRVFKENKYRGVMIGMNINICLGIRFTSYPLPFYLEWFAHLPSTKPLGNFYEMSPPLMTGLRSGILFLSKTKKK